VAVVDIHQHLLPPRFIAALRHRTAPPRIIGTELSTTEGSVHFDPAEHDLEQRLALLDQQGIGTAVLSLQQTFGQAKLEATERAELDAIWEDGITELVAAAGGRLAAVANGPRRHGFVGSCVGSDALTGPDLDALEPILEPLAGGNGFLFVHPTGGPVPPGTPPWWAALAVYTAQMQEAYLRWLAHGQERWPEVHVVFAILAGGGPFQLERLASRGLHVRSALRSSIFFDTASYGRRALELCIETFGVEQLVYGSDVPVVDPAPTRLALKGFGESVERLITQDTPNRLMS
jgi:6-methylsalicylate decarboxylase